MKSHEKQLFRELCQFQSGSFDEELLRYATPHVLGQLFYNRVQGIAYRQLYSRGLSGKVSREFRDSLKYAYEQNIMKNRSFYQCVAYLTELLKGCSCRATLLKGALLCGEYPEGCRSANDIDLLVHPSDVTTVGNLLFSDGFRQGNIRNGVFIPANRREIIESKMTRGETIPYIKPIDLPGMKYLEVDLNFSLDYKNGDGTALEAMLDALTFRKVNGIRIPTLCREDFLIHLCVHLYKEASTLPWIEMHRDMTLYKYADIYFLLGQMTDKDISEFWERAKELETEKICAFAILQTAGLFDSPNKKIVTAAKKLLRSDSKFLRRVIAPKEKKTYLYRTASVSERFFMDNRADDLEEENE